MSWVKGVQECRYDYSAKILNKEILEMDGFIGDSEARVLLYKFLRNNISFASELLLGIKLFPFQHLLIKSMMIGDFSMYVLSRGMSKTFSAAIYVMLQLLFRQGVTIGVLSSGFRQAKFILQKAEAILKTDGARTVSGLFELKKGTDQWSLSCGNSIALALPLADGSRLRGFRFSILLLDEFLNIGKNIFQEVILPFLGVIDNPTERADLATLEDRLIAEGKMEEKDRYRWTNNKLILLSSPSFTFEYMYEVYCLYRDMILGVAQESFEDDESLVGVDAYRIIFQLSYDCAPPTLYDKNQLKQAKATMSQAIFEKEYGGQFVTESDSYFKLSKMQACTVPDGDSPHVEIKGHPDDEYIISVDPSWSEDSSSDDFAFSVFKLNKNKKQGTLVHAYGLAGTGAKFHIRYFLYLLQNFNCKMVVLDFAGGVQFVSACNESEMFKDAGIELGVLNNYIDGDFTKSQTYKDDLIQLKQNLAPSQYKICLMRVPTNTWIREANELLQANIDHKRIWFAAPAFNADYEAQKSKSIPIGSLKWDRKYTSISTPTDMVEFIDHQNFMINYTKQQCANIEIATNPQGSQTFRLPPFMTRQTGPNKPRKDNYTSLVLGNWAVKIYFEAMDVEDKKPVSAGFTPFVI